LSSLKSIRHFLAELLVTVTKWVIGVRKQMEALEPW
jgi:hypothetical protein